MLETMLYESLGDGRYWGSPLETLDQLNVYPFLQPFAQIEQPTAVPMMKIMYANTRSLGGMPYREEATRLNHFHRPPVTIIY